MSHKVIISSPVNSSWSLSVSCPVLPAPVYVLILLYLLLVPVCFLSCFTCSCISPHPIVPAPGPCLFPVLFYLLLYKSSSYCTCSWSLSVSCPVLPVPDYVLILLYLFLDLVSVLSPVLPSPCTCLCRFVCYLQLAPIYVVLSCYKCSGPMFLSCPTCSWSLSLL
jgi:hypothetical protein